MCPPPRSLSQSHHSCAPCQTPNRPFAAAQASPPTPSRLSSLSIPSFSERHLPQPIEETPGSACRPPCSRKRHHCPISHPLSVPIPVCRFQQHRCSNEGTLRRQPSRRALHAARHPLAALNPIASYYIAHSPVPSSSDTAALPATHGCSQQLQSRFNQRYLAFLRRVCYAFSTEALSSPPSPPPKGV